MPNEEQVLGIVGELDPDKMQCDCCHEYVYFEKCKEVHEYPCMLELENFLALAGISNMCKRCYAISSRFFAAGAECLKQKLSNEGAIDEVRSAMTHITDAEQKLQNITNTWFGDGT